MKWHKCIEHQFLEEEEADAFLSTLPTGTNSTEEIREVTDHISLLLFLVAGLFLHHVFSDMAKPEVSILS